MPQAILVINPNSTEAVTRAIDAAVEPLRLPGGPPITALTLPEGPPGIESQREAAAFVIACFSDPGLHAAREATEKPVLGIAECGVLWALTLGHRFGVIAILARSVPRHLRYIAAMGVKDRLAADLPIELGVAALADERATLRRLIEV